MRDFKREPAANPSSHDAARSHLANFVKGRLTKTELRRSQRMKRSSTSTSVNLAAVQFANTTESANDSRLEEIPLTAEQSKQNGRLLDRSAIFDRLRGNTNNDNRGDIAVKRRGTPRYRQSKYDRRSKRQLAERPLTETDSKPVEIRKGRHRVQLRKGSTNARNVENGRVGVRGKRKRRSAERCRPRQCFDSEPVSCSTCSRRVLSGGPESVPATGCGNVRRSARLIGERRAIERKCSGNARGRNQPRDAADIAINETTSVARSSSGGRTENVTGGCRNDDCSHRENRFVLVSKMREITLDGESFYIVPKNRFRYTGIKALDYSGPTGRPLLRKPDAENGSGGDATTKESPVSKTSRRRIRRQPESINSSRAIGASKTSGGIVVYRRAPAGKPAKSGSVECECNLSGRFRTSIIEDQQWHVSELRRRERENFWKLFRYLKRKHGRECGKSRANWLSRGSRTNRHDGAESTARDEPNDRCSVDDGRNLSCAFSYGSELRLFEEVSTILKRAGR